MIICIDCRMIDASGIGVYLQGCLPFVLRSRNEFLLLGNAEQLRSFALNSNIEIIDCNIKPFSMQELFFFPIKTIKQINRANIYFSPFFNIPSSIKIPVYITIHDIIFPDMPELISKIGLAVRMWFYRRAYKKSHKILTVSHFSKSRIEYHLGMARLVVVTYSAIKSMFLTYRANAHSIQKKETIIFIGNIKKHKGLDYLLDAFLGAKKEGLPHKLVIIGTKENFRTSDNATLQKIELIGNNAISFTGFISDEQVMEYLSEASLLVQPSLYEGFGLPPLEAMVLGTSVLLSDIPVFKEIYNEFPVVFFQAGNTNDLKNNIMGILYNKQPQVINLPQNLLGKYTFEKIAQTVLRELAN